MTRKQLLTLLIIQSAVQGMAGSASLSELVSSRVVAAVALLSATLSSITATLVAATRNGGGGGGFPPPSPPGTGTNETGAADRPVVNGWRTLAALAWLGPRD